MRVVVHAAAHPQQVLEAASSDEVGDLHAQPLGEGRVRPRDRAVEERGGQARGRAVEELLQGEGVVGDAQRDLSPGDTKARIAAVVASGALRFGQ